MASRTAASSPSSAGDGSTSSFVPSSRVTKYAQ